MHPHSEDPKRNGLDVVLGLVDLPQFDRVVRAEDPSLPAGSDEDSGAKGGDQRGVPVRLRSQCSPSAEK